MVGSFIHFLALNIYKNRAFHLSSFVMFAILVAGVSATLFIKSSILHQTQNALAMQPEFVVQSIKAGQAQPIDEAMMYELENIFGVNGASGRVYGRYFHLVGESYFWIVGVDPFDQILVGQIESVLDAVDMNAFLSGGMVVSSGIEKFLKKNHYGQSYNFFLYNGGHQKVDIVGVIDPKDGVNTNDIIYLPMQIAREVLGLEEGKFSDIVLQVDNDLELETVENTIYSKYRNVKLLSKERLERIYQNSYDFRSGLFLTLSVLGLVVFAFMLYFKYSHTKSSAKKEIGILRALGWSIKEVLKLKLLESFLVASFTFMIAFIVAFVYVYLFDGAFFKEIFLGFENIAVVFDFTPVFEISLFIKLYLLFVSTYCAAVLVPVWRLCITSAKEAMK